MKGPVDNRMTIVYTETLSKNKQPGLKNLNRPKKVVEQYEEITNERGFYYWFNMYLARVPKSVKDGKASFWVHPLQNWKGKEIWYCENRKIGKNHFAKLIKEAYNEAGLEGDFTIRSIRSSVVNELALSNIDNAGIKSRTGHSSDKALDEYKRPRLIDQQIQISDILTRRRASVFYNVKSVFCSVTMRSEWIVLGLVFLLGVLLGNMMGSLNCLI